MASVTDDGPVFLDTTVLVAGLIDFGAASEAASAILDSVATHRLSKPLTAGIAVWSSTPWRRECRRSSVSFRKRRGNCWTPKSCHASRYAPCRHAVSHAFRRGRRGAPGRRRIYDLHIAEVARSAGAHILVTDNDRHFSPFARLELRVLSSKAFAVSRIFSLPERKPAAGGMAFT